MRGGNVPVIFGIKLKQFREEKGFNLKTFAEKAGLSPSYINEIEKGKKYPKADKIIRIADALEISFDDMVSLKLDQELDPIESMLDSPVIRELPLQLFGISQQDVVSLITKAPKKAVALVRALDEITRSYDMRVEHFFYAMLRSYQEAQGNYFEEIETAVEGFLETHGWQQPGSINKARLAEVLESEFDVVVDEKTMDSQEDLQSFRSIWIEGKPHTLLINGKLSTEQQVFQMGREVAYRLLGLKERGITSSRPDATSFEQVLNDFKASYFAGAMLIPQVQLLADLRELFRRDTWDGGAFLKVKQRYGITPEMFLYRLTQIIPHHFGLDQYYFLRFNNPVASKQYRLTKQFNMSPVLFPTGIEQDEHYCRRWAAVDILRQLEAEQREHDSDAPVVGAQVSRFIHGDADYFVISVARPLALRSGTNTSVTLGFRITERFRSVVKFWNDPALAHKLINETCERCGLSELECGDRIAVAQPEKQKDYQDPRKMALAELLASYSSPGPSA